MADQVGITLAKVAKNYKALQGALVSARGTLESIERRTVPIGDAGDEATAAIARSGIRSIDDAFSSLEVL
jgi:hypothetical protein